MPFIRLETLIDASTSACFDASRSIELHLKSMQHAKEKAVAGRTSGLIELNEKVTWVARHFGVSWRMTVQITQLDFPDRFTDEMVKGPFQRMKHVHRFIAEGDIQSTTCTVSYCDISDP